MSKTKKTFLSKLKKQLSSKDAKDLYPLTSILIFQETKILGSVRRLHDKADRNPISIWMDKGSEIHGPYHRLHHGHDFIMNIAPFTKKFGIAKLHSFSFECIKDFLTPNGLPLPGTQYLTDTFSNTTLNKFGTLNITDSSIGLIALYDNYRFYKNYKKGFTSTDLTKGYFRIGFKAGYGIFKGNPLLVLSGVMDAFIMANWFIETGQQIQKDQNWLKKHYQKSLIRLIQMEKKIGELQSEWNNDKERQKEIDNLVNEAMDNNDNIKKPKLRLLVGGK